MDLRQDYAREVMRSLVRIWKRSGERGDDRGREAGRPPATTGAMAHDAPRAMSLGVGTGMGTGAEGDGDGRASRPGELHARDPDHWLRKYSAKEWIRAGMKELRLAETAYKQRNVRAGLTGCKRAAGMALNAALIVEPNDAWKRTYVEHLSALAKDLRVPDAVSAAARVLLEMPMPGGEIVPAAEPSPRRGRSSRRRAT